MMKFLSVIAVFFALLISCESSIKECSSCFTPGNLLFLNEPDLEEIPDSIVWISLNDRESLNGFSRIGDSIYQGESYATCLLPFLEASDDFEVNRFGRYARDSQHVYHFHGKATSVLCPNCKEDFCLNYFCPEFILTEANPNTFQVLTSGYAIDDQHYYFGATQITDAQDSIRFPDMPLHCAITSKSVYLRDELVVGADPNSFHYDPDDRRNKNAPRFQFMRNLLDEHDEIYVFKDKGYVWLYKTETGKLTCVEEL